MVDTDWEQVAKDRINDNLDFKNIRNKGEYQEKLAEFLTSEGGKYYNILEAGKHKKYSDGRINPNYAKTSFKEISDKMYAGNDAQSKIEKAIALPVKEKKAKQKYKKIYHTVSPRDLANVRRGIRTEINKDYGYKQYRSTKTGRFIKKPY